MALLEGRMQEQAAFMMEFRSLGAEHRQAIRDLREEMERRFEAVDRRFDQVDRRFSWLVGIVVTGFVTTIGAMASAFGGLLQVVP